MPASLIGFCRFSFFGPSDTKLSYKDKEDAFQKLYDPRRMETRFTLLEKLLLPCVRAQTDQDFQLVMLTSKVMPETFRTRLKSLCSDIPQIEVVEAESEDLGKELRRYTTDGDLTRDGLMQFRIDDDDALSIKYIERLRHWAAHVPHRTILTMPKGLMLFDDQTGIHCHPMYRNLTGAGYAFYTSGATRKTAFSFAHIASGRRIPYVSDPTIHSFIQTFTASSDTAFRAPRKIRKFLEASGVRADDDTTDEVKGILESHFPHLDLTSLKKIQAEAQGLDPALAEVTKAA